MAKKKTSRAKRGSTYAPGFLKALAECGNVSAAAKSVGVARQVVYALRKRDAEFAAAWKEAAAIGAEGLEDEARRRAYEGTLEPRTVAGQAVDVRRFSDTLLIFLLKGAMPEKYADRQKVEHTGADGGPLLVPVCGQLHDALIDEVRAK